MNKEKEGEGLVRKWRKLARKKKSEPPREWTTERFNNIAGLPTLKSMKRYGGEARSTTLPSRWLEKADDDARVGIEVEHLLEPHCEVKPADEPIDATTLFADIEARFLLHLAMPRHLAFVTALFIGQSWIHEHATYSPILFI